MTDDLDFVDAGLDSLLSLVISSRLKDEFHIDFESTQFLELRCIGELKKFLQKLRPTLELVSVETHATDQQIAVDSEKPATADTEPKLPKAATPVGNETANAQDTWPSARKVVAEELGIVEEDLADSLVLSDIGLDSLLSLVITSRLHDELDIDLPQTAFIETCSTIADLRNCVSRDVSSPELSTPELSSPECSSPKSPGTPSSGGISSSGEIDIAAPASESTPRSEISDLAPPSLLLDKVIPSEILGKSLEPAWSMVLQGSPKRSEKTLFLFPDGCGAATSYLNLPKLGTATAVVGFNSPFMKKPHMMADYTLEDVIRSYVLGIRKHQPHGPYRLGGWSAGGILAYAIAQQLIAMGEEIASLTLIDSPPPNKGLDRLPDRFFDHCTKVGLFGNEMQRGAETKVPEWLMPHFRASIELLHDYHAQPLPAAAIKHTKVTIIWAGECAFDGVRYPRLPAASFEGEDTEGMKFLTERRLDLGPGAWEELFPDVTVSARVVENEHHFSMMRGAGANRLAQFIRESMR